MLNTRTNQDPHALSGWIRHLVAVEPARRSALLWVFTGTFVVMLAAAPLALAWAGIGYALGRRQETLRARTAAAAAEEP